MDTSNSSEASTSTSTNSPLRPQTPYVAPAPNALWNNDEGAISEELEAVLKAIFNKYATHPKEPTNDDDEEASEAVMDSKGLERFGIDTNGSPIPNEQIEEMKTFLDCDDQGNLTLQGFIQMYQLQTMNDEEETWKDLKAHGYNDKLELVSSRKEDQEDSGETGTIAKGVQNMDLGTALRDHPEETMEISKDAGV